MRGEIFYIVIPAQAGIQVLSGFWTPAFPPEADPPQEDAGVTGLKETPRPVS